MKPYTLVIGASENPERYANIAIQRLKKYGHPVKAVGLRKGNVNGVEIETGLPEYTDIDTITLYVGPKNQHVFKDYILKLKPRRVIFNPGTESFEFEKQLIEAGIKPVEACTLVMLSTGQY